MQIGDKIKWGDIKKPNKYFAHAGKVMSIDNGIVVIRFKSTTNGNIYDQPFNVNEIHWVVI